MLRRFLRALGGFIIITVLLLVVFAGKVTWDITRHKNVLSEDHLAAKQDYLSQLSTLPKITQGDAPNVVVILFDDMGLGDIGIYGNELIKTPNLDAAAQRGLMMTNGFSAAPYCTPSRAGLLTGRFAGRMNLNQVTFPHNSPADLFMRSVGTGTAMPQDEITIAEILRARGYRTHMVGKWHLGDGMNAQPLDFGFESFFGVLFSNDMTPFNLYSNREIVRPHPIDQSTLTAEYTRSATDFIDASKNKPFFLYFAHSFPHIPLYADKTHAGQSDGGLYGDVIEDLDRSVGAVMAALDDAGVADNTLIFITSDNGPWYQGSTGNSRGRKNETFDGGMRVPFMVIWPDGIKPAVTDRIVMGTDFLPTMLAVTGTPLPQDRKLDGASLTPMFEDHLVQVHEALLLEKAGKLEAIRTQTHKLRDDLPIYGGNLIAGNLAIAPKRGVMLFNLTRDPGEFYDVTDANPELRASLEAQLRSAQEEWENNKRGWRN